jgi:hypothetical protein
VKETDLSITFHIVNRYYDSDSALNNPKCDVKHKDKLIETLFKIKNDNYPLGWLEKGNFFSHHCYDVASIINLFYEDLDFKLQKNVKKLYETFLKEILKHEKNGGFTGYLSWDENPTIESTYFAVKLLQTIGYFDLNESAPLKKRIKKYLSTSKEFDLFRGDILDILEKSNSRNKA